jgi:tRNA-specific 2-thiouridylase
MIPGKTPAETLVVVAMSGGVDSSTVAAMLVRDGYRVIGMTMQLYDVGESVGRKGACCAGIDIYDAKQVADKLAIPHYVLNYESNFKQSVIDEFADSYLNGETPIPCIKCNQTVKFRDLLTMAKDLGADALATGHYVKRVLGNNGVELHKAVDGSKDQSYFLFATTKEQLAFTHFPLGSMNKAATRELALELGLEVAGKPDSQDICFVPNGSYADVIAKYRPGALDAGEIVDLEGNVLGQHEGIINFTVGQRRGLKLAVNEPLYVIKLDAASKKVIVGPESALEKHSFIMRDVNWLGDELLDAKGREVTVKLGSRHVATIAHVAARENNTIYVKLSSNNRTIAPGQACVIYDGERVLGGGWITSQIN